MPVSQAPLSFNYDFAPKLLAHSTDLTSRTPIGPANRAGVGWYLRFYLAAGQVSSSRTRLRLSVRMGGERWHEGQAEPAPREIKQGQAENVSLLVRRQSWLAQCASKLRAKHSADLIHTCVPMTELGVRSPISQYRKGG